MRRLLAAFGLGFFLVVPGVALASTGSATSNITLAKGDNRTGTYYAAGQTVTIDGNVDGDVVCAGQTVVVNGSVTGDVLCAGQEITVNGPVAGSVRAIGQVVTVNGTVGRNVTVGGQNIVVGSNARIDGELVAGAQSVSIHGSVARDAQVGANSLELSAQIGGNLNYMSDQTFPLDHNDVKGSIVRHAPPRSNSGQNEIAARLSSLLFWVLGGVATMLVAVWLFPDALRKITNTMAARPGASLGWGALTVIAGPAICLILALTVIGIPLAILGGIFWVVALTTSGLFAGTAVGRLALGRKETDRKHLALAVLTGVPLVLIIEWLPWVGFFVSLVALFWAMGGIILSVTNYD